MSDILPGLGVQPAAVRRRGRPPGSGNKRSSDLLKYIEAQYAGLTPGQQAAAIALVTPREVRQAKGLAKETGLHPTIAALVLKAKALALALGCSKAEAWELIRRERADLMPYVHQRRPQAIQVEGEGDGLAVLVVQARAPQPAGQVMDGDWKAVEENQRLNDMVPAQVSQPKSHDEE